MNEDLPKLKWKFGILIRRELIFKQLVCEYNCNNYFIIINFEFLNYFFVFNLVNLVERNHNPDGFQLVNPAESGKVDQFALVELAGAIQQVICFYLITENTIYF